MPDDDAISKSHSQWTHAADQLDAFDHNMNQKMKALNDSWTGRASDTFTSYMDGFQSEVSECAEAIRSGAATIERTQLVLTIAQTAAFAQTLASLVVLAALEVVKAFPPARPGAQAAQQLAGGMLSVATSGTMTMLGAKLAELGLAVLGLSLLTFVTEKDSEGTSADRNGIDFEEVSLSQEEIDRLESDAGSTGGQG